MVFFGPDKGHKGILTVKNTQDIPDQNSGMSDYEYISDPGKMDIGLTGKTRPFDKCRLFLSGISVGY